MNFLKSFQHKGRYTLSSSFAVDFRSMKGIDRYRVCADFVVGDAHGTLADVLIQFAV